MKKKLVGILLCATMVATMAAACGSSSSSSSSDSSSSDSSSSSETAETTFNIGFALKTQDSPYFVSLGEAVQELADERGWNCTILDANGDSTKERENVETFISQDMDLIFLDAVEPESAIETINAAADADIPVINLDSGGVEDSEQCTTVYSDNEENGRLCGIAYVEYLESEGRGDEAIKAILLSGVKGNTAGQERRMGLFAGIIQARTGCTEDEAWEASQALEDELTANGKAENTDANFVVAGQGWGNWTKEQGLTAAEDLITANTDLTCVLGENDQMLFGALDALDNAGIEGVDIVAAADGAQEAYDLIMINDTTANPYIVTGENSPTMVAQKGFEIADEILIDGNDWRSYDSVILTEAVAVTRDNVEERYDYGF